MLIEREGCIHMSRVKQREDVFYDLFKEFAAINVAGAETWVDLFEHYPEHAELIKTMKEHEVRADQQVAKIMAELTSSFITPFDRADIDQITRELDEFMDAMEEVSSRLDLFDVQEIYPPSIEMTHKALAAAREMQVMFEHFPNFKKDPLVTEHAIQVGKIEDDADLIYRHGLSELFHGEQHSMELLKWKSLLDAMENALDSAKNVSNRVLGVVMQNA